MAERRGVTQGRLQKSLGAMTFGVVREISDKQKGLDKTRMAEREQEFQIPIRGLATTIGTWTEVELTFRVEFLPASGMRDSPYIYPTMTYGHEVEASDPVAVQACVTEWKKDKREVIFGAKVKVCAWQPGDGGDVQFRGRLHMIFSGFGSIIENEVEDDE